MQTTRQHSHEDIREAVRDLCQQFPGEYFRKVDEARDYPEEFVNVLTKASWLAAMIPQEYGGSGLGLTEASIIMKEINRSGGNSGACHGQMYNMGTLLRHGSDQQKQKYLPKIVSGALRLQSMGVTEPTTGTDTTKIKTTAFAWHTCSFSYMLCLKHKIADRLEFLDPLRLAGLGRMV